MTLSLGFRPGVRRDSVGGFHVLLETPLSDDTVEGARELRELRIGNGHVNRAAVALNVADLGRAGDRHDIDAEFLALFP